MCVCVRGAASELGVGGLGPLWEGLDQSTGSWALKAGAG